MNEHPFSHFIDLVQCDQKIHAFENNRAQIDQDIVELKAEQERVQHDIQNAEKKVSELKKTVERQEREMKVLDQQEQHKKIILANISDYKQYQSVKVEIDAIQKNQLAQEEAVLTAWNQLETAQVELEKKQHAMVDREKVLAIAIEDKENKGATLVVELDILKAQRPEKEKAVPDEWLEKYSVIKARVSDPVVAVTGNCCGACSQTITPADLARIRHGALIQCRSCFRLIYSHEVMDSKV